MHVWTDGWMDGTDRENNRTTGRQNNRITDGWTERTMVRQRER